MLNRFSVREYVAALVEVLIGMFLGAVLAVLFHRDPFTGEAAGGIFALAILAVQTYQRSRSRP